MPTLWPYWKSLYQQHRDELEGLPEALRSLRRLSDDFDRRTGLALPPWDVWEAIVRRVARPARRKGLQEPRAAHQ